MYCTTFHPSKQCPLILFYSCDDGKQKRDVECRDGNTDEIVELTLCEKEFNFTPLHTRPCKTEVCENDANCGGHGLCMDGYCICNEGYIGDFCEIATDEELCGSDSICCHTGCVDKDGICCESGKVSIRLFVKR